MSDDKVKTAAITAFTQYMSTHKLRKTPERYAILEKVFDITTHFVVETLYSKLEDDGYHVSKATIYNTLLLLTDAGLVRRHTFAGQPAQFEKISGITNHHHLVCSRCGKVKEITDPEIDELLNARRYGSFHPAYVDLHIYGVCSRCLRKSKKQKN
ncbi:MAG: transcriptional repressor [Muribaculaceae bacterium]|nr:transcriptional repressor [Muribaculaceae bacterium]